MVLKAGEYEQTTQADLGRLAGSAESSRIWARAALADRRTESDRKMPSSNVYP